MSIRNRLLLLVLIAMLVPAILLALRFVQDRDANVAQAVRNLQRSADALAGRIDDRVRGTAQLHYGLARSKELDGHDKAICSTFLSAVREEYPQYTGILTIDPDGELFCNSLNTGRHLTLTDRGYFKEALITTGQVTLEPVFGRLTGTPVLQIAYPVREENGTLRFVLLASLNLSKLVDDFEKFEAASMLEIVITDRKGTLLVGRPMTRWEKQLGEPILTAPLFQAVMTNKSGETMHVAAQDGIARVWTMAAQTDARDSGLIVLVGMRQEHLVEEPDRRLRQDMTVLLLASLVLFSGVWLLAGMGIRKPIGRIAAMARGLSQGDLGARITPPHPRGEIGELMLVMNATADSLQQQRAAIDDLNLRLRQSQKMEALGQLTGGIAHDFNNLLTVILGNAEMLVEKLPADSAMRPLAEMTQHAALRGADLTNRLLAFSRRQPLDPKAVNVGAQIAAMDGLLRRTLSESIEIKTVSELNLWPALTDPGQLESAVLNLCINARDAMPGGGRLTVELANVQLDSGYTELQDELAAGDYVLISISDTGTGMSPEVLAQVFEPFFTTKDVGKGTGLGLSMVYGFAKQSNGHVRIYSEPAHGTTVKLYLPRAQEGESGPAASARDSEQLAGGSETILLVEDDVMVRAHVLSQLRGLGYQVVDAADGPSALVEVGRMPRLDLLFTDVIMPKGMNGPQLAEAARALRPGLRVLFTSGYTENAIVHHGRLDAGVHLLSKPYRRKDLADKLRQALDERL